MQKRFFFVATLILISLSSYSQDTLLLVDPLEPVYPDTNNLGNYGNRYALDFPSGTVADVHVLLKIPAGQSFTVTAYLKGKALPVSCWSRLVDVPVEQNTGLDSRTEVYRNQENPYVIRRAPFRIYEAMVPLQNNRVASENAYTCLRLSVPAHQLARAGKYAIRILVEGKGWEQNGLFTAQVYQAKLPALPASRFFYTNWFSLPQMEEKHRVVRWTEPWYTMLDQYAKLMAHGRQNCIMIPAELIALKEGRITLDEEKMHRFVQVFRKHGFNYFESPHLMYRGDNDDWGDPELKTVLTKKRYHTPEAKRDVDTIVRLIKRFTARYQLTNNWLQHISDEPTGVQARCYREVVKQVKSVYPEIKIMEATNDRDSLVGAVDLWCPLINDFQENEKFFREREKQNEKVLVYTCLIPGGKWLNRLLDQERLRQVYFGWGAAMYHTFGFLHWGLNQYCADPWQQSVVQHPAPGAGANNKLPAGDTHCFYPGEKGPVSGTRFEAHRIGIEDYELLEQLKQENPTMAVTLIKRLFTSYTEYNRSVSDYRKERRNLLHSLKK